MYYNRDVPTSIHLSSSVNFHKLYTHFCFVLLWLFLSNFGAACSIWNYYIYESFISLYFKPADNVDGAAYQNTQSVVSMLSRLTMLQPTSLIDHEDLVVNLLPKMLEADTPRKVQMLTCKLWMKLNIVIPRRYSKLVTNLFVNNYGTRTKRSCLLVQNLIWLSLVIISRYKTCIKMYEH